MKINKWATMPLNGIRYGGPINTSKQDVANNNLNNSYQVPLVNFIRKLFELKIISSITRPFCARVRCKYSHTECNVIVDRENQNGVLWFRRIRAASANQEQSASSPNGMERKTIIRDRNLLFLPTHTHYLSPWPQQNQGSIPGCNCGERDAYHWATIGGLFSTNIRRYKDDIW